MLKTKKKRREPKTIRLCCNAVGCAEHDFITATQLRRLKQGWKNVGRFQTYAQSIKTYDDPHDAPAGYSVLDWYTHLGDCPDCAEEAE